MLVRWLFSNPFQADSTLIQRCVCLYASDKRHSLLWELCTVAFVNLDWQVPNRDLILLLFLSCRHLMTKTFGPFLDTA